MKVKVKEIALPDIKIEHEDGTMETVSGFDSMVIAAGRKECSDLAELVRSKYPEMELYVIGDAKKADTAIEAIADAAVMAANL